MTGQIHFYNTLTREKEPFVPLAGKKVTLYTCGPTVYDFAHIGNFRTYVFEDLLRRTLKYFGYEVVQAMNITDVDDKTIKGAIKKNSTLLEYVEPYKKAFFEDLSTLSIEKVEYFPQATDYIPQMIEMIKVLIDKGIGYIGHDGSIYYSIKKFPTYGALSHLKLDELQEGASQRINNDEYEKEAVADFVLWKAYDEERDGKIYWESPWGKGRPGWHLECSAMSTSLLGSSIDIHCGAVDNIFPHHENEIAQSEGCSCCRFVKYWMHSEHLIVDGKKMSKSLGNFYTLRDLLSKGYTGREIRYLLLSVHYKTQLNFTMQSLEGARHALNRIDHFVDRLKSCHEEALNGVTTQLLTSFRDKFDEALRENLSISIALAALFDLIRDVNGLIDSKQLGKKGAEEVLNTLQQINAVLHVIEFEQKNEAPEEILQALADRNVARKEKNWKEADRLRDFIAARGFIIEDSASGSKVVKAF
jgi:cysteinyl-tRNA synthetase